MKNRSEYRFARRVAILVAIIGAIVATLVPIIAGWKPDTEGLIALFLGGAIFSAGSWFLFWFVYLQHIFPGVKQLWEDFAERFKKEPDLSDVEVPPVDEWIE